MRLLWDFWLLNKFFYVWLISFLFKIFVFLSFNYMDFICFLECLYCFIVIIFLRMLISYWGFKIIIFFSFGELLKWIIIFWLCRKFNKVENFVLLWIMYLLNVMCLVLFSGIYLLCFIWMWSKFLYFNYFNGIFVFISGNFFVIVSIFFFRCMIFRYLWLFFDLVLFMVKMFLKRCFLYVLFCKNLYILSVWFLVLVL